MELAEYWAAYNSEFDRARAGVDSRQIAQLLSLLEDVRLRGRHLFVLGNGGSAASAAHWACDFGKGASVGGQRRFRVLAPNEQVAWHTALGNDVSYADALAEQLRNWAGAGDLIVALSVSGDSENLVRACAEGRRLGARVAAIVGASRGRLAASADLAIVIPSRDYGVVEDLHMTINHALSQYVSMRLREEESAAAAPPAALELLDPERRESLLASMDAADRELVRSRFGLDDGVRRTLGEVAARHGRTVEQVRGAEQRLFRLLEAGG